jgi:hypothetical protein
MGSYKRIISILLISILFIFSIIFLYNAVSGEGFRGGGGRGGFGRYGGRAIGADRYYGGGRGWRSNYYNSGGGGYVWIPWLWYPWHRLYSEEPVYYVPTNKVPYYPSSSYNYPYNNLQM